MRLLNKTVLITGATSGIGKACVEACLKEGAKVIFTGRDLGKINNLQKHWGNKSIGIVSDASNVGDQNNLIEELKKHTDVLDGIYFNAGDVTHAPLDNWTEDVFDRVFSTNVKAPFFLLQKALPLIKENSSIVFCGSTSIHIGLAQSSIYAASKSALRSLVRTLSGEFLNRKIRFNLLSPGPTKTEAFDKLGLEENEKIKMINDIKQLVPLGRLGTVNEQAAALVFLLSDESSFMLGTEILVDGGVANI